MTQVFRGSCLCGQVTFQVSGFSEQAAHCHCKMCRKFHGAAFGTLVSVSSIKWLSGLTLLHDYVAPNGTIRTFCKECGSSIGFRSKGEPLDHIEIAIATLDGEIPVKIDAHIYTNYKACWHEITDELPQFREGREE
jgi:hypothetical protein